MQAPCFLRKESQAMKAVGVTAEFNPLHNGHLHLLEQARLVTGADAVVVAMSGDFVQRGEPAVMDKWLRTEHALKGGADLVIEIPTLFCLGNAGQYARAGVGLLEATGKVSEIAFGSESGDIESLGRIAKTLKEHGTEIEELLREHVLYGFSYPAARALAYSEMRAKLKDSDPNSDPEIIGDLKILNGPNDILAIEYMNAMQMTAPAVIRRKGAGYGDGFDKDADHQSASAIRAMALEGKDVSGYAPAYVAEALKESHLTGPERDTWFDALRYAVLSTDPESIEDCPSGEKGLAALMKSAVGSAGSWEEFIRSIKSRRYTYTRISRLCMQLLLGITRNRYDIGAPGYIRVLGFSEKGRRLLAGMRDEDCASLPVIINVNKAATDLGEDASKLLELDMHAADIYNLMTGSGIAEGSDHVHAPVMVK